MPSVRFFPATLFAALLLTLACSSKNEDGGGIEFGNSSGGNGPVNPGNASGGTGTPIILPSSGTGGQDPGGGGTGGECEPKPIGLLRDFQESHPDFEYVIATEKGIVGPDLGADKKPIFTGDGLRSVHTAYEFNQWYNDTPGVNITSEYQIEFVSDARTGHAVYDNPMFFPLDGQGWGNEDNPHNFHFTFELHMEFRYGGGEVFTFRGDDDVFVFVNNKLAIDLGGVHDALTGTLDLDEQAAALGITPGNIYPIDFFQAERHTTKSSFRIETNLNFTNCKPILVR